MRILVADDNSDFADTTALLLEMAGHDVRAVYNGPQAIEAARSFHPVLAILDLKIPLVLTSWHTPCR